MADRLSQANRIARLNTPLGQDVLVLVKLRGTEGISDNFEWRIHCLLNEDEDDVDPSKIVGKPCHVEFESQGGNRYYHGLCTEIRRVGRRGRFEMYELVLRPWTWLLTRETNCEIFHEKSVKDIIQKIFNDRGFSDFKFTLKKTYDPIPYCVHYQETTYAFVSRLMEKYGLFFYFEFSDSKHNMVIVDDQTSLPDIDGYGALEYQPDTGTGLREERINDWETENRLRTAVIDVDDYNYEKPNTKLEKTGNAKDSPNHGYAKQKYYLYPTGHNEAGVGQHLADVFVDVERADAERKFAAGYAPKIFAGGAFTLKNHPIGNENKKHFAVVAEHFLFLHHYLSSGDRHRPAPAGFLDEDLKLTPRRDPDDPDYDRYEGKYEVADSAKAYKAPLKTPWPRIHGAQTAEVIKEKNAPDDEEIDVDDKGRILVRFHWNARDAESDKCSCRLRVAQIWAGPNWGGIWIPRVGQEVVVEFLNGDPDTPLVTGTVYNGKNESPITFPDNKTQSTIMSDSSKGGNGFNELRFEDKKDDEEIYIHAERDRRMEIEHEDDITIGANQTETIGGSRTFELTAGDETITLKGKPGTNDKYGSSISKSGHRTTTLEKGDETLTVKEGKRTTKIKMDDKRTITDGNDIHEIKMGNQTTTIDMGDQTTTLKMGNQTTKISLGKGTTTAMQSFEIKVGGSSIKLEPMKITIKAPMIDIKADMMLNAKGMMTTVDGSAMLMLKGGLVKIN